MKRFNFVHLLTMIVLIVILASCGLTQPGYGDDYSERPVRGRQVYSDPYYSNAPTIVRDPYTGRYYEVIPVSPYGFDPYGARFNTYGDYRNYGRGNTRGGYNNVPRRNQSSAQPQQPQKQSSETIDKAKNIIRRD